MLAARPHRSAPTWSGEGVAETGQGRSEDVLGRAGVAHDHGGRVRLAREAVTAEVAALVKAVLNPASAAEKSLPARP